MKGMALCRQYWEEVGRPALEKACPGFLDDCAVGLVGEGSECFGFDDEISRDHDWGPGFCLWLTDDAMQSHGGALRAAYAALPDTFGGYRRLRVSEMSAGRVGVMTVSDFYRRYTGLSRAPETIREWRLVPLKGLSVVTNGEVFSDRPGVFSAIREDLLKFYPEDLRRKKLAAACAEAAQSGQYNYLRCLRRGEAVAASLALARFISAVHSIVFLLNRRYMPYYKWSQRALRDLPVLGAQIAPMLDRLTSDAPDKVDIVERISELLIAQLQRDGLTDASGDFLLPHAESVQRHIEDPQLRMLHLMAE